MSTTAALPPIPFLHFTLRESQEGLATAVHAWVHAYAAHYPWLTHADRERALWGVLDHALPTAARPDDAPPWVDFYARPVNAALTCWVWRAWDEMTHPPLERLKDGPGAYATALHGREVLHAQLFAFGRDAIATTPAPGAPALAA